MAGQNVGTIEYEARINTAKLKADANDVESTVNKTADNGASSFKNAMNTVTAVSAVALGAVSGYAIKSFASYEQLAGGVETLFKDSAGDVKEYANMAYKTAGLSANQYMETVTSFSASLLQGLGGDTKKASKVADVAIRDMSDNANKMGTAIGTIQYAYQGFAKDNYMMLDNLKLGYGGTAGEMARLVNNSKVMGSEFEATAENVKDIPFDKLIEAIHKTQEEMGITGTTAKEASSTISGSWHSLTAAFTNVATGVEGSGQQLSDTLLNMISQLAQKVPPIVGTMFKGMVQAMRTVVDETLGNGAFDIISTIGAMIIGVATAVTVYTTAVSIATGVTALWNAALAVNPIILVGIAIAGLVAGLIWLATQTQIGRDLWQSLSDKVGGFVSTVAQFLMPILQALWTAFTTLIMPALQGLKQEWDRLLASLQPVMPVLETFAKVMAVIVVGAIMLVIGVIMSVVIAFAYVLNAVFSFTNAVSGAFQSFWARVTGIFQGIAVSIGGALTGGIKGAINAVLGWAVSKINSFIDMINGVINIARKIPGVGGLPNIGRLGVPAMAEGGVVNRPTLALIGEGRESEAVLPLSKLDGMLNGSGGGRTIHTEIRTLNIYKDADADKVLRKLTGDSEITSYGLTPKRSYMNG